MPSWNDTLPRSVPLVIERSRKNDQFSLQNMMGRDSKHLLPRIYCCFKYSSRIIPCQSRSLSSYTVLPTINIYWFSYTSKNYEESRVSATLTVLIRSNYKDIFTRVISPLQATLLFVVQYKERRACFNQLGQCWRLKVAHFPHGTPLP